MVDKNHLSINTGLLLKLKTLRLCCLLICLSLFSGSLLAGQVLVSVDKNPISLNDSVQLLFTAQSSVDGEPNFSPLEQDFEILNQHKSTESSWVNGTSSATTSWSLTVMAKRLGHLSIPAISFGSERSNPLILRVTDKNTASAEQNSELFLEVQLSADEVYVQAQAIYTLRLFQRIQISQASLTEPSIENAIVEPLGEGRSFRTQVDGVDYVVTERRYAIFPQKSGTLIIEPLMLQANIVVNKPRRTSFNSMFNRQSSQTKRFFSDQLSLHVLPIPNTFKGQHWLPSEQLELQQSWSNNAQATQGEPLTRTIRIKANGITASKLPAISMQQDQAGVKLYPDKALTKDQINDAGVVSTSEQKIAIIPSSAGSFSVPAIEVPWFNTRTKQMEVAILPQKTIYVAAATTVNEASEAPAQTPQLISSQAPVKDKQRWFYLSIFLGLAWLATLALLIKQRAYLAAIKPAPSRNSQPTNTTKAVKSACLENNPQATLNALIEWGQLTLNAAAINDILATCDGPLKSQIQLLTKHLYGEQTGATWDGQAFLAAFEEGLSQQTAKPKPDDSLEPLFRL